MVKTRFDDLLREEIKYHRGCAGSSGKGELFERGFLEGLRQAKTLFYQYRRIIKREELGG